MGKMIDADLLIKTFEEANAVSFYELNEHSKECYEDLKGLVEVAPPIHATQNEQIEKMKSEIEDSLEFWDYHNNNPLVRDILESIKKYCGEVNNA